MITYLDYSSYYSIAYVLAVFNLGLGAAVFFICFCRVVVSSKNVLGRVRLKYILIGPSALAVSLNPIWGWISSTYADTFFMIAVLIGLMSETYQWKHGPPASVRCDAMAGEIKDGFMKSWLHRAKVLLVDPLRRKHE
jgi:hypothetical protein